MQKRGQITIFIIIGIVILAASSTILYFVNSMSVEQLEAGADFIPSSHYVKSFITNCLEESSTNALELVFSQGGYYNYPSGAQLFSFTVEEEVLTKPYYFYEEEVKMPSLKDIKLGVARATEDNLIICFDDFKSFEEQGYNVDTGSMNVEVSFNSKTTVDLIFPIKISIGEDVSEFDFFSTVMPFNFPEKYNSLEQFLDKQKDYPDSFVIGELSSVSYKNDDEFGFLQYGDFGSDILVDLFYEIPLKESPLMYEFALNFNWEELEENITLPKISPSLVVVPNVAPWKIISPGIKTFQIIAEGENLIYSAEPDSLEIDSQTGIITLDPSEFENDEYLYFIRVEDLNGNYIDVPLQIHINVNDGSLPVIKPIPDQNISVGENLLYNVETLYDNGNVTFSTDSYLFDIDQVTGLMNYTADKFDIGTHSIRVDATNEFGNTWQRWELVIK